MNFSKKSYELFKMAICEGDKDSLYVLEYAISNFEDMNDYELGVFENIAYHIRGFKVLGSIDICVIVDAAISTIHIKGINSVLITDNDAEYKELIKTHPDLAWIRVDNYNRTKHFYMSCCD